MQTQIKLGATEIDMDWNIREDEATIAVHSDKPLSDVQQLALLGHVVGDPLATLYDTHHMRLHCMLVYKLADNCHQDMDQLMKRIKREIMLAR